MISHALKVTAFAALMVFALPGCIPVPFPHKAQTAPRITGQLTNRGTEIAGAQVSHPSNPTGACTDSTPIIETDREGFFTVPGSEEERRFLAFPMVHCGFWWSLCFDLPSGDQYQWDEGSYGPCETPEEIHLVCDIGRDLPVEGDHISPRWRGKGICRYTKVD